MSFYNQPYGNYPQGQAPGWQNQQYSLPQDGFNQPPTKPKKSRKPLIAGIIIIIIAILAGTSSYILFFSRSSVNDSETPAAIAVLDYLHALNDNDAKKALSYSLTAPPNKDFLTNEILAKEIPAGSMTITDAHSVTLDKESARVFYSLQTKGKSIKGNYDLDKIDDSWKLGNAVLNIEFDKAPNLKLQSLTIWGKPVKGDLSKIYVFPGELQLGSSIPGVVVKIKDDYETKNYAFHDRIEVDAKYTIEISADLDDATRNKYKGIITRKMRDCVAHDFQQENCPNYITELDTNQPIKIKDFKIEPKGYPIGQERFRFLISQTGDESHTHGVNGTIDFTGKQITYSFDN